MTTKVGMLLLLFSCSLAFNSYANTLRISLAQLPLHAYKGFLDEPRGTFVDLVQAMDAVYPEGKLTIKIYPFARSLENVITGRADVHIPLIKAPNFKEEGLPYTFASEIMGGVTFVLYSRADKPPLDMNNLAQYTLSTMRGHKEFFPFEVTEDTGNIQGIEKVLRGRTDGYLIEQDTADNYIKTRKIKNIRRTYYSQFDFGVVIPTGPRQQEIDNIISKLIRKLKEKGEITRIFQVINTEFVDWQPYEMPW